MGMKCIEIPKEVAVPFIFKYHYSNILPKINKHFVGFYLELGGGSVELVGVVTLGYGVRPLHTIARIYDPELVDVENYLEIGRMCMSETMPRNSESQMLSLLRKWVKANLPDVKVILTWADGMIGKVGYVYQASGFEYLGKRDGEFYMKDGYKLHVRQMRAFLPRVEGDTRITVRPTLEQMKEFNISHYKGYQYLYITYVCGKIERKRLIKNIKTPIIDGNPKDNDLSWRVKDTDTGKWIPCDKPPYDGDLVAGDENYTRVFKED